jgi:hypothetical protein
MEGDSVTYKERMEQYKETLAKDVAKVVLKSETKEQVAEGILKLLSSEYYTLHPDMDFDVNYGQDILDNWDVIRKMHEIINE